MPGVASAKKIPPPKTDVLEQCAGVNTEGDGSSFQAPLQFIWTGVNSEKGNEPLNSGFNHSSDSLACSGTQGSKAKPTAYYNQEEQFRGSGACLRALGEGTTTFGEEKPSMAKNSRSPR